jgi:hypothetical protein
MSHHRDDDDDYDRRSRRSRRAERDEWDDRRRRREADSSAATALGGVSLGLGILALIGSLIPCFGVIAIFKAVPALILGIAGIVVAKQNNRSAGLPVAGTVVSGLAVAVCAAWFFLAGAFFKGMGEAVDRAAERANERDRERREREQQEADEKRQKELLAALAADKAREEIRNGPGLPVTAEKLNRDYTANVVAADARYKGQVLELSGTVVRVIRTTDPVRYTVELSAAGGDTVDCNFRPVDKGALADVADNQKVTIRGRCKGMIDDGVVLDECILVK